MRKLLVKGVINLGFKLLAGAGAIAINILAARQMSTAAFGELATILSYCALVGGLSSLGGDHFFKRLLGASQTRASHTRCHLAYAAFTTLVLSLVATFAMTFFLHKVGGENGFGSPILWLAYLLMIGTALTRAISGAMSGAGLPNVDAALSSTIRPGIALLTISAISWWGLKNNVEIKPEYILFALVLGFFTYLLVATVKLMTSLTVEPSTGTSDSPMGLVGGYVAYIKTSIPLSVIGSAGLIERNIDTIMLATIAGPEAAAIYYVCTRVSVIAMLPLQAINSTNSRRLSRVLEDKSTAKISNVLRSMTLATTGIVVVLLMVVLLGHNWLFGLFGEDYSEATGPMILLMTAWLVRATLGPVNLLSVLSGNEKEASRIAIWAVVFNIVLNAVLIPLYGVYGAVIATASARVLSAVALNLRLRYRLGVKVGLLF